jgi:hypothetical protein
VVSLVLNPDLIKTARSEYHPDVIERAEMLLGHIEGNVGAYSESLGLEAVRKSVA